MNRVRKLHDEFFKRAKREGYLARSAYKLMEIDDRRKILRKGSRVLDVGSAPGSWLQVLAQRLGPKARIVGVDLQRIDRDFGPTVRVVQGDITEIDPAELTDLAGGLFHTVVSDMAPNTTGAGDDLISTRLCRELVDRLPGLLAPGGTFAMKVLEGSEFPELLKDCKGMFTTARAFKPISSRSMSRETFIIASGYTGGPS